jgi:hypothetical protein
MVITDMVITDKVITDMVITDVVITDMVIAAAVHEGRVALVQRPRASGLSERQHMRRLSSRRR